ncbi:uncharacterized protein DDB_G0287625-like [Wyeomyia smithii]|uniref:uncharacterized protein DDB_G0287625-like n=1 Tax=Wyeomyia smithii TaxID=174621 RepID=UPI002467C7C9|nr:uncharacterized protein DDB_G0287625-like [Wyeomyia smithii]
MSRAADYVFPKADALQCIPEFRGHKDELEAFLYHVQHFADEIPENGSHSALIYVVLLKLKGKAAAVLPRIKAESWPEVKRNLIKEFGSIENIESVIKRIETLRQEPSEDYSAYKRRTIEIKELLDTFEKNQEGAAGSAVERSLRIHFIGGLRISHLKLMAGGNKKLSLDELLDLLEERGEECEQLADVENRLRCLDLLEQEKERGGRRWQPNGTGSSTQGGGRDGFNGAGSSQNRGNERFSNRQRQINCTRNNEAQDYRQQPGGNSSSTNNYNYNNNRNYRENANRGNERQQNNGNYGSQSGGGWPNQGRNLDSNQTNQHNNNDRYRGSQGARWNGYIHQTESQDWRVAARNNNQQSNRNSYNNDGYDNNRYNDRQYHHHDDGFNYGNNRGRSPGRGNYNNNNGRYNDAYDRQFRSRGYERYQQSKN